MSRQLYLYSGITPNIENGAYLVFNDLQDFLNYLQPNLFKTIPLNNYRINADTIKVAKTNDFDDLAFNKISYVIDADIDANNVNYFKAFFVNSFVCQSEMLIFKITLDIWATYQNDVKLSNVIVSRCNTKLPFMGYYNEIKNTITNINFLERLLSMGGVDGSASDYGVKYMDEASAKIVFLAKVVTSRNTIGTSTSSITQLFGIDLDDVRQAFGTDGDGVDAIALAIDLVSHIYSLRDTAYEVEIVRAWIVTEDMAFYYPNNQGFYMKTKPFYKNHSEINIFCACVKPSHIVETKSMAGTNYDINFKHFAGVYGDGLELTNEVYAPTIELEYVVSESDVQITIMQGDKQRDITNAFEVSLSGQSQEENNLEKMARWARNISEMLGMAKSTATAGISTAKAYGVGAVLPVAQYVLGVLQDVGDVRPSGTIAKGGGASTFAWSLSAQDIADNLINYPFYFTRFKSAFDEKKNAKHYGAQYVAMISANTIYILLNYIEAFSYLGEDANFNLTFVALDACVEGVPLDAITYFRSLLHDGLYLKQLSI